MALRRVYANNDPAIRPSFNEARRKDLRRGMSDYIVSQRGGEVDEDDLLILTEAYERFQYCSEWEAQFRDLFIQDTKFANADADNGWQWPDDLRRDRMLNRRPALTINKVINHVNLVVNDGRQNKASIQVKPSGKEASFAAAKALEALIRNIEYQSSATAIYDDMSDNQVTGGIGYGRITTIYPDARSFNQELRIVPVDNHLNCYLDPDIKMKSGLDAKYGFLFEDITGAEYERQYDEDAPVGETPLGLGLGADWVKPDHVRIAEYYRVNLRPDELIYYKHSGQELLFLRSEVPRNMKRQLRLDEAKAKKGMLGPDAEIITRPTEIPTVQWYKIGAHRILDREEYRTQYVPLFRFVGREKVIDGRLERKGLVRGMKDAQRLYNYNSSAEAEAAALATKTNWLVAVEGIMGFNNVWDRANVDNKPYLPYRHKDRDGDPIPPPQRIDPAKTAEAYVAGMEIAARELEMTSGQGPAQFGKPTKERSGKAIGETQRQGEILTFDFIDNQALGIQAAGIILLDWIPHCYKTKQVVQILDRDGTERMLTIDPQAPNVYEEQRTAETVQAVLNPTVGKYKVQAQPGPAYATQRQEAWNAFVQIITGSPELINEIGDLMFLAADFPMADEIAERMRRKIKQTAPWLLDDNGPGPIIQGLNQQIQQASQQIAELLQQLAEKDRKLHNQSEDIGIKKRDSSIKAYDAHTRRIKEIGNATENFEEAGEGADLTTLIRELMQNVGKEPNINREPGDEQDNGGADFHEPRLGPDGNHYIRHKGQHYKVDVGALNPNAA